MTRGFVTIATGEENYYVMAVNLLKSYRFFSENPLPFAIISDRENKYTKEFDETIILKNPHYSYFDKIEILNNIPFDETIFIEADCLAYYDLNAYFDAFSKSDDFSMFGRSLPLDTKEETWFKIEEVGEYKNEIQILQRFQSCVAFMRNGEICKKTYKICCDISENYSYYNVGGSKEAIDDKLFAIGSAAANCRMTDAEVGDMQPYCCYYIEKKQKTCPKACMRQRHLSYIDYRGVRKKALLCHWTSGNTKRMLYKRETISLNRMINDDKWLRTKETLYTLMIPFSDLKKTIIDLIWDFVYIEPIYRTLKLLKNASKRRK